MRRAGALTIVVAIFVWTLITEAISVIHIGRYGKYSPRKLDAEVFQQGPRRSGILETVQVIPTPTPPTSRDNTRGNTHGNTTLSSTDSEGDLHPLKTKLTLKTNFSRAVNDHSATTVESGIQNTTNGPQKLVSYSLDPPNSFPQPTSIPPIDTLAATWPTPMGSIDSEMNDFENPPTLEPIGTEMTSMEKIPEMEGIPSVGHIPLNSFEEESPWERSHFTSGNAFSGHAINGHASHTVSSVGTGGKMLVPMKSRNEANATRRGNVAGNLRDFSKGQHLLHSTKLTSFKVGRRQRKKFEDNSNLVQHANKHKKTDNKLHPWSFNISSKSKKRVFIPPPESIDPIQPLLLPFQREKEVGAISEHTLDFEPIKPHEAIDKHLLSIESQPKIGPIKEHLSTEQLDTIEPIENHKIALNQ